MTNKKRPGKPKNHVSYPPDTSILKDANTPRNLKRGWEALGTLWKQGLLPKDTRPHFYMTWLAYNNGNVNQLAKSIGKHRNTIVGNFQKKMKKQSTFKLRKKWFSIKAQNPQGSFTSNALLFYSREFNSPKLSPKVGESLMNIWLMGIDKREVQAHFVLWHKRQGRKLYEIADLLGTTIRNAARSREYYYQKGSTLPKWFKPLDIKKRDWLFPRGKGRPKKK